MVSDHDACRTIGDMVSENLKPFMKGVIEQMFEKERGLLEELIGPIQEHIWQSESGKRPPETTHSGAPSVGSWPMKRPTPVPSVVSRFEGAKQVQKACLVPDHQCHKVSLPSTCSRRSSRTSTRKDLQALQNTIDVELLALAELVPSTMSTRSASMQSSVTIDIYNKGVRESGFSGGSASIVAPSMDGSVMVPVHSLPGNADPEDSSLWDPLDQGSCSSGPHGRHESQLQRRTASCTPGEHLRAEREESSFCGDQLQRPRPSCATVEYLRAEREAELTKDFQQDRPAICTPVQRGSGFDFLLRACGFFPCFLNCDEVDYRPTWCGHVCNTLWQKLVLCAAAAACGNSVWLALDMWRNRSRDCHACLQVSLLFDVFLSLADVICLLDINVVQRLLVFRAHSLLLHYAHQHYFIAAWRAASWRSLSCVCAFSFCVSWGRARLLPVNAAENPYAPLGFSASLFAIVIFMSLEFYILHVCHALATMVDCFAEDFLRHQNPSVAIREWNIIQATMRKVCVAVQWIFLVLQVAAVLAATTGLMAAFRRNAFDAPALLPGPLVAISVAYVFYRATVVTNKCERLTRFINSISFSSKEIDKERQYVVDYINNSGAGFYFFNVRLTSQMAMKIMYVSGLAAFYTATQAASIL